MDAPEGAVSFLAASENRVDVLQSLRGAGSTRRRSVADSVDASGRTVKRTLDALEERGWVVRDPAEGRYRLSALGELVLDEYERVTEHLGVGHRFASVLERVPAERFDLDPLVLSEADIVERAENDPYAPVERVLDLLASTGEFRAVVDVLRIGASGQIQERILAGDLSAEVVVHADALEASLADDGFAALLESVLTADTTTFHVYEDDISFLLGIMDDVVVLGVTDDQGLFDAVLVSDSPVVRKWAIDRFEAYRAAASELDESWASSMD